MIELEKFEELEIFKVLKIKTSEENYVNTTEVVKWCLALLPFTNQTFKKYTIHHAQHQYNILVIFQKLLKSHIHDLTDMEIQFLILSSVLHDIGMVFTEQEKLEIKDSVEFSHFLDANPSAKIIFYKSEKQITDELLTWYCRSIHAVRVYKFLFKIDDKLKYNGYSIREKIGLVCESHNWKASKLLSDKLPIDYIDNCDTKFCALLLRLADILDFDYTRSPLSMFEFIDFKDNSNADQFSKQEWLKHICSDGFKFNENELLFYAKPTDPTVEFGIRSFLKMIENELKHGKEILNSCHQRHRNFILPKDINKKHIIGQEYSYGEYTFTVDKNKIVNLLMGENIYSDRFSFIRELLQNSIDAINFRSFIDNSTIGKGEINTFLWKDKEGHYWFRVDDSGHGMTKSTIKDYFLKIGSSFYTDNKFLATVLDEKGNSQYVPISRFGIGILSIFLAADIALVNTYSSIDNNKTRLTIDGRLSYYYYQTESHKIKSFPNPYSKEELFRHSHGTSICIRLKNEYILSDFENRIRELIKNITFPSNYLIKFNDSILHRSLLIETQSITLPLAKNIVENVNNSLNIENADEIRIELKYLNIEELDLNFIGGYCIFLQYSFPENIEQSSDISFSRSGNQLVFDNLKTQFKTWHTLPESAKIEDSIYSLNDLTLSFNGIVIPIEKEQIIEDEDDLYFHNDNLSINFTFTDKPVDSFFVLDLNGTIRPDLPISRERIREFNFTTYSNIAYTILHCCLKTGIEQNRNSVDLFGDFIEKKIYPLSYYFKDNLILSTRGWNEIEIFSMQDKTYSIKSIKNLIAANSEFDFYELLIFYNNEEGYFTVLLQKILLDINFEIQYKSDNDIVLFKEKNPTLTDLNNNYFPPLFSIQYDNNKLSHFPLPLNSNHKLLQVINEKIELIKSKHQSLYNEIIESMYYFSYDQERIKKALNKLISIPEFMGIDLNIENDFSRDKEISNKHDH